jgi:glycosyltransferase involved in cell wall biosynthesis
MAFITCKLLGGLGNQLFQLAACIGQAEEQNIPFFIIDRQFDGAGQGSHPEKYYDTIYQKIAKKSIPANAKLFPYNEPKFAYTSLSNLAASCKKNERGLVIRGYFQSEKYFEKYADKIRDIFTPAEGLITAIQNQSSIFQNYPELHPDNTDGLKRCLLGVRRGDYLRHPNIHNPCSMDYYKQAMDVIKADVYYIISDDIAWCRANFTQPSGSGPQYRFLDEPDDYKTFLFARLFRNYICANSSFHWWASYLSHYPNPTVITLKEHFGPAGEKNYSDYFRKDMILISNTIKYQNPLITVCIPLYNGVEFLAETLASVKAQTYTNWKCIIGVNGHGLDGGYIRYIAEQLVAGDGRFRVINYPFARNVADTDNAMVADAEGEWIAHLDADDVWSADKLQKQVEALGLFSDIVPSTAKGCEALNGEADGADIIGSQCSYFGETTGTAGIKSGWITTEDLKETNHIINSSTLLRKSVAKYSNRFVCEDYDLWIRSALKGHKIYNVPDILVAHRIHSKSNFNASNKQDPTAVKKFYYADQEPYTLVTAFYPMKSKFSISNYLLWIKEFFETYDGHMVIYTEANYAKFFQLFRVKHADRTRICVAPKESWGAIVDHGEKFWADQYEMDHEKEKHSAELYMIWYQKNDFMQRTIRENPFGHQKFMWCDAGVVRNGTIKDWVANLHKAGNRILADKMTVLEIQPFTVQDRLLHIQNGFVDFTQNINRIGGGILAGGAEAWAKWDANYKATMKLFVEKNLFIGKDQNLFANMVLKYPNDVNVVRIMEDVGVDNYWFYLLRYFSAPINRIL